MSNPLLRGIHETVEQIEHRLLESGDPAGNGAKEISTLLFAFHKSVGEGMANKELLKQIALLAEFPAMKCKIARNLTKIGEPDNNDD